MTKFKFWLKYYWIIGTFRRPLIEHIAQEFSWIESKKRTIIECLDISPGAVKELQIVNKITGDYLEFVYAVNGGIKYASIPLVNIIYLGDGT